MPDTTNEKVATVKKTVRKKGGKASSVKVTAALKKNATSSNKPKTAAKRTKVAKVSRVRGSAGRKAIVTSEERHRMIAEAAFYLAEKRGFAPGHAESDWAQAAQTIDEMIINA